MNESLQEILQSSVEEKTEAVEAIWDSIDNDALAVTDEEIQIAKYRYAEHLQNPDNTITWEAARKQLTAKYGF